jgi:hypothetical protein
MFGAVAVWLAGGAVLAADGPAGQMPGSLQPIVKGGPPPAALADPLPPPAAASEAPGAPSAWWSDNYRDADYIFGSFDYVLFWVRNNPTPGLVQVIPPQLSHVDELPPDAAVTIFGDKGTDPGAFDGIRAMVGMWLTPNHCWGVDGSYLHLFQRSDSFFIHSNGVPVIGREFVDPAIKDRFIFLQLSTPEGDSAFVDVKAPVEMYTFDANLRRQGPSVFSDRVDYLAGIRYLNLRDAITIDSGFTAHDPATGALIGSAASHESFRASNKFYGTQVGLDAHSHWGCLTLDLLGKVAMGWVHQEASISGFATTVLADGTTTFFPNESILYVQKTNVGSHSRDRFAVVPELLVKLGYQITPHVRACVGYDLLTVTSVERSGAAIDPAVNPSKTQFIQVRQPSDIVRPAFQFHGTDFWAQGITFGLTVTY